MLFSRFFFRVAFFLLPVALLGTTWLYLYPIFHSCAFPTPPPTLPTRLAPFRLLALGDPQLEGDSSLPDPDALVFPSVEYLIPDLREASSWAGRKEIMLVAAKGIVSDAGRWLEGKRKTVDLWGNDWYLAHIVRTLRLATKPTHIAVLGDLLGSQWVTDGEFRKRAGRYWGVVMRGLDKVPDDIFGARHVDAQDEAQEERHVELMEPSVQGSDEQEEGTVYGQDSRKKRTTAWGGTTEILGADKAWATRVINIAGNHDVGYAGDLDESRLERFERAFGSVNWDVWFTLPDELHGNNSVEPPPALRLVILNTMNLDTPAWSPDLQTETYAFINHVITTSRPVQDKTHATVLLTHIPLEKEEGVCVDSPYFDFFEDGQGVKEQNMLSGHASKIVLEGIFGKSGNKDAEGAGLGRGGVIINGHDHAGCDVLHFVSRPGVESDCNVEDLTTQDAYWPVVPVGEDLSVPSLEDDMLTASPNTTNPTEDSEPRPDSLPQWHARRYPPLPYDIFPSNHCLAINEAPQLREVTLRSMMGEFSGYAGFLSAWFDATKGDRGEWVFEFASCGVGVQHWWWGVHVLDCVLIGCVVAWGLCRVWESPFWQKVEDEKRQGLMAEQRNGDSVVSNGKATAASGSVQGTEAHRSFG